MNRCAYLALLLVLLCNPTVAQTQPKKTPPAINSPLCARPNAIDTLQQQIAFSRTVDNPVQRIAIILRAADLLWPYDREKSLAAFMEAFELAKQHRKEKGDDEKQDSKFLRSAVPDQRFKVISALAQRSAVDAQKLTDQVLDEDRQLEDNSKITNDKWQTAEKLLGIAGDLIKTNTAISVQYARTSLRYPATLFLTLYIYRLSSANRVAADKFYEEALRAYQNTPMKEYLYLSAYPFGNTRDAGKMPSYTFYRVPDGFAPNPQLQRLFVVQLLDRAQTTLTSPVGSIPEDRLTETEQMWLAFSRLENQIAQSLPDLAPAATATKEKLFSLLSGEKQIYVTSTRAGDNPPKLTFEEEVEAAEKEPNEGRRDQKLTFAVTNNSKDAPIERVIATVDKISDGNIRTSLLNWFYFKRSQALIEAKKLDEARQLAAKITELDQRAYLYAKIAEEFLKENEDQTKARELLNELAAATDRAPKTIVTARAKLALANLYTRIDANRGVEELANAIKTINALEAADFSVEYVTMKIEGKTFGSYSGFSTPGFNPENVFKDIAKVDFDGSLVQAATFTDKSLRAMTTMAVIEPCLEIVKGEPKKPPTKKP